MAKLVAEISPLIPDESAAPVTFSSAEVERQSTRGRFQAQYALNVSLLVVLYRKLWYGYDQPRVGCTKTIALMFLNGVVNVFGVLLIAIPFDNYRMSRNLTNAGWSRRATMAAYLVLTYPAYVWWAFRIARWMSGNSDSSDDLSPH